MRFLLQGRVLETEERQNKNKDGSFYLAKVLTEKPSSIVQVISFNERLEENDIIERPVDVRATLGQNGSPLLSVSLVEDR